ncbi:alpha-D-ribose 1-methylphosphonate 5-triphosphate diphosphatase [Rhodovulum strictum]|uniref:Alpha-D-ribose 1-methylphosphonate 5-triphosphate diphosphatase n=1 Tax=Rhodovulum strictum TaxID=58314 RepID=A0A844B7L3_9RHOB|nr:alpha-D-ribose 1-methylphosphonate 5-triphosphate diphosphatase [Rhodovulum strictum]MRH22366.1 alpha-D-ribose 1-methylphosphonate 5-triphosphate diphosphatase [Rhodovulum strictum]
MTETVLANARLVLPDGLHHGALVMRDGRIARIDSGTAVPAGATDCEGDLVMPGLIELHTDNLERHIQPRPGVDWPHGDAILAHDAELAALGITTVFDALRVGSLVSTGRGYGEYARGLADEIMAARAAGLLRISHYLHLRAEVCSETLIAELAKFGPGDRVGIVSLMDHTPGQRQFANLDSLRAYTRGKYGMTEDEFQAHVEAQTAMGERVRAVHEAATVAAARAMGAVLASHDDTTSAHVAASAGHGAGLAEFPTTSAAARACHAHGIAVMMGAPNLIRGGSHSGNVAARDLAEAGLLDILSSDYVPASLLSGALMLGDLWGDTARGIATVTAAPARAAGLADRGSLAEGLRADVIRVRRAGNMAAVRGSWSAGRRVA